MTPVIPACSPSGGKVRRSKSDGSSVVHRPIDGADQLDRNRFATERRGDEVHEVLLILRTANAAKGSEAPTG